MGRVYQGLNLQEMFTPLIFGMLTNKKTAAIPSLPHGERKSTLVTCTNCIYMSALLSRRVVVIIAPPKLRYRILTTCI